MSIYSTGCGFCLVYSGQLELEGLPLYVLLFRIYRQLIHSSPERVVAYIKATIALHNYLRSNESSVYCPPCFTDSKDGQGNTINGEWRMIANNAESSGLGRIGRTSSNGGSWEAEGVREIFCKYFISDEGSYNMYCTFTVNDCNNIYNGSCPELQCITT